MRTIHHSKRPGQLERTPVVGLSAIAALSATVSNLNMRFATHVLVSVRRTGCIRVRVTIEHNTNLRERGQP